MTIEKEIEELKNKYNSNVKKIDELEKEQISIFKEQNKINDRMNELQNKIKIYPIIKKEKITGIPQKEYLCTVSLKIKNYIIVNSEFNTCEVLKLKEKNIIDIFQNKEKYDIEGLKQYLEKTSCEKLKAYFTFKGK